MKSRVIGCVQLLSALFLSCAASAQPSQFSLAPIDPTSALFIQAVEVDGGLSEASSQSLRIYGASLARYTQPGLEVLIIASAPQEVRDEAAAMRRAILVRDELSKASSLAPERFVLQVSLQSGLKNNPQETSIVVQPALRASQDAPARTGAQYAWAPEPRRFVIVCPDGYLPVDTGAVKWPDDFAPLRGCPQAETGRISGDRLRATFDGSAGRWFLACPNGEALRPRAGDLDDFSAIRRCN